MGICLSQLLLNCLGLLCALSVYFYRFVYGMIQWVIFPKRYILDLFNDPHTSLSYRAIVPHTLLSYRAIIPHTLLSYRAIGPHTSLSYRAIRPHTSLAYRAIGSIILFMILARWEFHDRVYSAHNNIYLVGETASFLNFSQK